MKGSGIYRNGCSKGDDVKSEVTCWQPAPQESTIREGELHLWRFNLDCHEHEFDILLALLTQDEIRRADRLLDLKKKKQFIVARARLRQILANYLKINPCHIKLQYNHHGKPSLAESHHSLLSFNLSHSRNWGILAIVNKFAVGIDIERIEQGLNFAQFADQFFAENEKIQLAQYPVERQRRGFYRIWTQKEAMLKAEGAGFQKILLSDEHSKTKKWHLTAFPIAPDYVCSIATKKEFISIQRFHFTDLTEL
ncbi:MAG: 4'-phosphopantetheinyl transferase superfamily protein [Desulfuromusa sp.]|nr:4'-phosphopantetheinyl transferase superfamily protein [Desulfuromusa sp.]